MAEKIKCDCGITFTPEEGQTHCNYCGIKLTDIGKGNKAEKKKESKNIFTDFSWLLWWRIDKDEIQRQVKEYKSLKITQSAKGISSLFLLLSSVVTALLVLFFDWDIYSLIDVFLFLILGFFIYRGHRWAMIIAMFLWTYERIYILIDYETAIEGASLTGFSVFGSLFFWTIYMHAFYMALRVEIERRKLTPVLKDIPNTIFCYKCGGALEEDSKFCSNCGTKVIYPPKK